MSLHVGSQLSKKHCFRRSSPNSTAPSLSSRTMCTAAQKPSIAGKSSQQLHAFVRAKPAGVEEIATWWWSPTSLAHGARPSASVAGRTDSLVHLLVLQCRRHQTPVAVQMRAVLVQATATRAANPRQALGHPSGRCGARPHGVCVAVGTTSLSMRVRWAAQVILHRTQKRV